MIYYVTYRLLILLLAPVIISYFLWLAIKNKDSRFFWQRLGFNYPDVDNTTLWFHCASVGEVNTLLPLLKNMHQNGTLNKALITTNTQTSATLISNQKLPFIQHSYLPFDWGYSIKRFLRQIKPASLFIMETEIWPTLVTQCNKQHITVSIINARLSAKSTNANVWVRSLIKYSLKLITNIHTRSDADLKAYLSLGANKETTRTAGNMKLISVLNKQTKQTTQPIEREFVLVASTHDDEEQSIVQHWKKLDRNELLLIAPRHPDRRNSIIKQLTSMGLASNKLAIRSKQDAVTDSTEVFLLDTIGELQTYFSHAKLVIMGGSFVPVGGHNILEPASHHCPIITGPYMDNFRQERDLLLASDAMLQLSSYDELAQTLPLLLDNQSKRKQLSENTKNISLDAATILKSYSAVIAH